MTHAPVLIVDNEQAVAQLLLEALARVQVVAEWVSDGRQVNQRVAATGATLIACDLDMPGFSGEQVVEALTELEQPPRVLVITGFVAPEVGDRLRRHSFVEAVLVKPFDVLAFARHVRQLRDRPRPATTGGAAGGTTGGATLF